MCTTDCERAEINHMCMLGLCISPISGGCCLTPQPPCLAQRPGRHDRHCPGRFRAQRASLVRALRRAACTLTSTWPLNTYSGPSDRPLPIHCDGTLCAPSLYLYPPTAISTPPPHMCACRPRVGIHSGDNRITWPTGCCDGDQIIVDFRDEQGDGNQGSGLLRLNNGTSETVSTYEVGPFWGLWSTFGPYCAPPGEHSLAFTSVTCGGGPRTNARGRFGPHDRNVPRARTPRGRRTPNIRRRRCESPTHLDWCEPKEVCQTSRCLSM